MSERREYRRDPRRGGGGAGGGGGGGGSELVPLAEIQADLDKLIPQLARALPKGRDGRPIFTPERIVRMCLTTFRGKTGHLILATEKETILGSIMQAAQLGLEIGTPLGHSDLVPYGKKTQLIIGYRGMVDLARRSGDVGAVYAKVVHARDRFHYEYGMHPKLIHVPARLPDDQRGEPTAAYAVMQFRDGTEPQFDVMEKEEIEAIRACSKTAGREDSPWNTWPLEMWKKTILRRAFKLWPVNAAAKIAARIEEMHDAGLDPEPLTVETVDEGSGGTSSGVGETPRGRVIDAPREHADDVHEGDGRGGSTSRRADPEQPNDDDEEEGRPGLIEAATKLRRSDPEAFLRGFGLDHRATDMEAAAAELDFTDLSAKDLATGIEAAEAWQKEVGPQEGGGALPETGVTTRPDDIPFGKGKTPEPVETKAPAKTTARGAAAQAPKGTSR